MTRLSTALRAATNGETQQYLEHRSALRRTLVRILVDIDNGNWTLRDDEILDQAEDWLRERLRGTTLPKAPSYAVDLVPEDPNRSA